MAVRCDIAFCLIMLVQIINIGQNEARPRPVCTPCPFGGCHDPTNCEFGLFVDNCERSSCAKGPMDRCRIRRNAFQGNCGDGMYCHCGVCMGCSLHTYNCYEITCVIPMSG